MGYEPIADVYSREPVKYSYLRCVKEIKACPELQVGDLLWAFGREIRRDGFVYCVCRRREDGAFLKFRETHLADCFEIEEVEE